MLKLKPRLRMAADMVRAGSRLADVGTDHAYLPAALILEGVVGTAVAADLRKGPLENARTTAEAYGISDKIQLRLSDGLKGILPNEADDIVIAGMGGILISEILTATPWVKDSTKRLILQPQSHSEDVRRYLFENGFEIIEETACFEDGKVYICICAEYTGEVRRYSDTEALLGSFAECDGEAARAFREKKLRRVRVRAEALKKTAPECDELKKLEKILDEVRQ